MRILAIGAVLLLSGISSCPAFAQASSVVQVHGTRVRMERPAGFSDAPSFSGFQNQKQGASIMVTELPAPFAKATAGFNESGLKTRNMALLSRDSVTVGRFPGLLVSVTQPAYGQLFRKWILSFGDADLTVVVTATWPDEAGDLSGALRAAVLSARLDAAAPPPPLSDLTFEMSDTPKLKLAKRVQNMLIYTANGQLAAAPKSPVFLAGQSFSELDIADTAGFARRRSGQIAGVVDPKIEIEDDITVSGLKGREITATGTDKRSGEPMLIYQTILFDRKTYYIFQGLVDLTQRAEFLPAFKEATRRFKKKS